jgi:hypothetical protein
MKSLTHNGSTIILALVTALGLAACGSGDGDQEASKGAPPPVAPGDDDEAFALTSGTYYVSSVHDLQDGCGKEPLNGTDPLTQVPFVLSNDGQGRVTIDFCSYDGRSVTGDVRGNVGTLAALHSNRKVGGGAHPAEFSQDCRIELTVTAADHFDARYVETQRNRNDIMRQATVDLAECTTSFDFSMARSD